MNLKFYREKANLTQEQLARKVGMSVYMITSIESGRRKGSINTLMRIAKALDVTTDDLLRANRITNSNINWEASK
ncbi:helix-turn-helix transcriptional regulator [Enterococcus pseudoavium]|uniref:Helix-turn-helix transcriptional regulator n=1 Tax=Enterococcus pseudoavium TaxID=44007 RepID=A0AAE4I4Z0_9ENTE|nr:helix-turn-helix transcriptional regulator [Enterococcus pseudoavium]MDT2738252.1 helix-turn-helix transcriptional regulator [Enterococcus pseudoavium]